MCLFVCVFVCFIVSNSQLLNNSRFEILYEYIINGFKKWLEDNDIPTPVIVFSDWHETRLVILVRIVYKK